MAEEASVTFSGWLWKKSKKRYIIVQGPMLYWAAKEVTASDPKFLKIIKGSLPLRNVKISLFGTHTIDVTTRSGTNLRFVAKDDKTVTSRMAEAIRVEANKVGEVVDTDEDTELREFLHVGGKKRWCVLHDGVMSWYASENDSLPKGNLELLKSDFLSTGPDSFSLSTVDSKQVAFKAKNDPTTAEKWKLAITTSLGRLRDVAADEEAGGVAADYALGSFDAAMAAHSRLELGGEDAMDTPRSRGGLYERAGWVKKKGKSRYLVLHNTTLLWFEKEQGSILPRNCKKSVSLAGCAAFVDAWDSTAVVLTASSRGFASAAGQTRGANATKPYRFVCADSHQASAWAAAIDRAVVQANQEEMSRVAHGGENGMAGNLMKKGQQRYFVLSAHTLKWYGSEREKEKGESPRNQLRLRGCSAMVAEDNPLGLELTTPADKKSYVLVAETAEEATKWVLALKAAIRDADSVTDPRIVFGVPLNRIQRRIEDKQLALADKGETNVGPTSLRVVLAAVDEPLRFLENFADRVYKPKPEKKPSNRLSVSGTITATKDFDHLRRMSSDSNENVPEHGLFDGLPPMEVRRLRAQFDQGIGVILPPDGDPVVATALLGAYLTELPEPLMTYDLYDTFVGIVNKPRGLVKMASVPVFDAADMPGAASLRTRSFEQSDASPPSKFPQLPVDPTADVDQIPMLRRVLAKLPDINRAILYRIVSSLSRTLEVLTSKGCEVSIRETSIQLAAMILLPRPSVEGEDGKQVSAVFLRTFSGLQEGGDELDTRAVDIVSLLLRRAKEVFAHSGVNEDGFDDDGGPAIHFAHDSQRLDCTDQYVWFDRSGQMGIGQSGAADTMRRSGRRTISTGSGPGSGTSVSPLKRTSSGSIVPEGLDEADAVLLTNRAAAEMPFAVARVRLSFADQMQKKLGIKDTRRTVAVCRDDTAADVLRALTTSTPALAEANKTTTLEMKHVRTNSASFASTSPTVSPRILARQHHRTSPLFMGSVAPIGESATDSDSDVNEIVTPMKRKEEILPWMHARGHIEFLVEAGGIANNAIAE